LVSVLLASSSILEVELLPSSLMRSWRDGRFCRFRMRALSHIWWRM